MNRRSLLLGAGFVALGRLLTACSGSGRSVLRIRLLEDSIPPQILREFRRQVEQPANFEFSSEEQLSRLFKLLQTWRDPVEKTSGWSKSIPTGWFQSLPMSGTLSTIQADLVTLGDYWMADAIQQQLIQPMDLSQLKGWSHLPTLWKRLVTRDRQGRLDPQGDCWGAPYRWGSLMAVYRERPFKSLDWRPANWSDLWRPELKQKISLPDHPRIVIGLALKALGHSCNKPDLASVPDLAAKLAALQQQVKFYSSDAYLQPLINEDTWLAVGWSTDILPTMKRYRQLKAVIPDKGTMLTADVWVQPAADESPVQDNAISTESNSVNLIQQWIDFCWRPHVATQLSVSSQGASPIFTEIAPTELPKALQNSPLLLPKVETFRLSEFLEPLSEDISRDYLNLWTMTRQA